jgi:hypothetical protein
MKNQKFTILLGWILFLSSNLFAQNSEGRFRLKEGDWFEVQVENATQTNNSFRDHIYTSYNLHYALEKQLSNNNQQYKITVNRVVFKLKKRKGKRQLGYDSYYPPFEENKTSPTKKNEFNLEVTPFGKIIRFEPAKSNTSSVIEFEEVGSIYGNRSFTNGQQDMKDSLTIRNFSNIILLPLSNPSFKSTDEVDLFKTVSLIGRTESQQTDIINAKINLNDSLSINVPYMKKSGVPLLFKIPGTQFVLTKASFPLPGNTIIQGTAKDQINKEVNIYMLGSYSDYTYKQFRTNKDGSFTCPIFLNRPLYLRIDIGNKTLTTFLEPGDTLNFSKIAHLAHQWTPVNYQNTDQPEYISKIRKDSDFSYERAEYNTLLSNEISQYQNYPRFPEGSQWIITKSNEVDKKVNALINSYKGKASESCLDYFRRDWNYFSATARLSFYKLNRIPTGKQSYDEVLTINDFPADFFLGVDTIPLLMNPFEWGTTYQNFLTESQDFKQERIGYSIGKWQNNNFRESYFFAQTSLKGYPLYNQLAKLLEFELRHELSNIDRIESYYQRFINNCIDPLLSDPLKVAHENAMKLKIGNQFPIKAFAVQDSSTFNLENFKGKPICIIFLNRPKRIISTYYEELSKFKADEVNFIIARLPNESIEGKFDSTILKLPNVTYIELTDENLKWTLSLGQNRIFMLDKWFRIVENNAEDPMTHKYKGGISEFEKSLRKTIETKRYTKAEKTAMIKTAGWSFGSILFTFLIGLWIYRIRIRRIKTQEAAKRRIKELEIKAIRSQMNPHFIFNALNSIQSLINGNQFKEANIYLSKFAVLLRGVLNNSEKSRISLSDELQAVELYCQLEQLRFEFKFEISIDPEVDCDLIEIPGMIIQPLAENAVVHGLSGKGDQGRLTIQVKRQNGNLCVCVSDNGVGLQSQKIDELSQKGFGLKLVEERINILNLDGKEAKLTVENQSIAAGTVATLIIPID